VSAARVFGSTTYYDDSRGVRGSGRAIGQFDYLNLYAPSGNSLQGTNQRIGQFDYLNLYGSEGTSVTGSSQRIGSSRFGTYWVKPPPTRMRGWSCARIPG
jgi:hypothetical protein